MEVPTPLILVGTGDYYRKILMPTLKLLKEKGIAYPLCTVDVCIKEETGDLFFDTLSHRVRTMGERLSHVLGDTLHLEPVVILGHVNDMHVSDAEDLVRAGFRVLIEKPFAPSLAELNRLDLLIQEFPKRIGLIEYYLTMKAAPLFACTGQLRNNSFFFSEGLFEANGSDSGVGHTVNIIEDIGKILSARVEVLEGEGMVGRLEHRGAHIISRSMGGGMIRDLGIHACAPLIPLEPWIGSILISSLQLKTAHATEYITYAKQLGISEEDIAESCAEFSFTTSKNIPITVCVGKYVLQNKNRRLLVIQGEYGRIELDLSNPCVRIEKTGNKDEILFTLPKTEEKYYSVIRTALLELEGQSPYTFSVTNASRKAQGLILEIVETKELKTIEHEYKTGANPEDIW